MYINRLVFTKNEGLLVISGLVAYNFRLIRWCSKAFHAESMVNLVTEGLVMKADH